MISQRLIPYKDRQGPRRGGRILLNSPLISDLIFKGEVHEIKEVMKVARAGHADLRPGAFDLHEREQISYEDALRNAEPEKFFFSQSPSKGYHSASSSASPMRSP
jgi:twitching motility protein PilU